MKDRALSETEIDETVRRWQQVLGGLSAVRGSIACASRSRQTYFDIACDYFGKQIFGLLLGFKLHKSILSNG